MAGAPMDWLVLLMVTLRVPTGCGGAVSPIRVSAFTHPSSTATLKNLPLFQPCFPEKPSA